LRSEEIVLKHFFGRYHFSFYKEREKRRFFVKIKMVAEKRNSIITEDLKLRLNYF